MIRKIVAGIFILVFFTGISPCFSFPFSEGETLLYTIKLIGIPAGNQVLKVEETIKEKEGSLYFLTSKVESSGIVSVFFQLKDEVESYVDTETLYPQLVRINIKENSRREKIEVKIRKDKDKIRAFIWDKVRDKKWVRELSSPPLDILSLVYWIRAQNLKVGKKFEVLLLDTPGSFKNIKFEVSREDKAYTYLGVFPAFVCEQKGVKNGISVWFSQDKRHLPLYIQVNTPFGYLTAILQKLN